jgi:DNA-binding transcriptional MerR regulator
MSEHAGDDRRLISIGEAAERLQMTPRTLRYYEELGLVASERSTGTSQRRYGPQEIERLQRIRELQTLLGLDLDEIGEQLAASDRLEGFRREYLSDPPPERRDEILAEGLVILERLRARVVERRLRLDQFAKELDERIAKYEKARRERSAERSRSHQPAAR